MKGYVGFAKLKGETIAWELLATSIEEAEKGFRGIVKRSAETGFDIEYMYVAEDPFYTQDGGVNELTDRARV